jgi:hypothetical protein
MMSDDAEGKLPDGWPESSYFRYQREHLRMQITMRGFTNHETREVLVGLWASLDKDDQLDHIRELIYYHENAPGTFISGIAEQIRDAGRRRDGEHRFMAGRENYP